MAAPALDLSCGMIASSLQWRDVAFGSAPSGPILSANSGDATPDVADVGGDLLNHGLQDAFRHGEVP